MPQGSSFVLPDCQANQVILSTLPNKNQSVEKAGVAFVLPMKEMSSLKK